MTPDEIKRAIEKGVASGVGTALGRLTIDREQHNADHGFVKIVRESVIDAKKTALKTAVGAVVIALLGLIWAAGTGKI